MAKNKSKNMQNQHEQHKLTELCLSKCYFLYENLSLVASEQWTYWMFTYGSAIRLLISKVRL